MNAHSTNCPPRLRRALVIVALLSLGVASAAAAQSRIRARQVATPHFTIEVPEKDWRVLPGGVSSLGLVTHKDEAAVIVIEHELLRIALGAEEIDRNFAELELETIKEREARGSGFAVQVAPVGRRRAVVVDYQRPGARGPEQVRVVVVVNGRHLYRLVYLAPARQFAQHLPVFELVSASFVPAEGPA